MLASSTPCGLWNGKPLLRGVSDDGAAVLFTLGKDGTVTQARKWASTADSPSDSAFAVLPEGQVLWGDRNAGLWVAATPEAEADLLDTGFLAAIIEVSGANTLVANYQPADPEQKSRIFSSDTAGSLTEVVATEGERIGSPAFVVPGGVVAVSRDTGRLMLIAPDGTSSVFASSRGKLSMNPEGLAATNEDVVFVDCSARA